MNYCVVPLFVLKRNVMSEFLSVESFIIKKRSKVVSLIISAPLIWGHCKLKIYSITFNSDSIFFLHLLIKVEIKTHCKIIIRTIQLIQDHNIIVPCIVLVKPSIHDNIIALIQKWNIVNILNFILKTNIS